ncbi:murein L,D-transpeptidase catalytic domain family protein [Flavobacterium sp. F-328]|uniref:Murein L,D-transpeptidase catalytic domain family protein n=1 Tax=Flavobacterium erciyesense TaxID=2825842 RepID=A0ABS5CZE8_9FLAO|nr:murein L,D-transpeptidase catalytic domain family protein [Flavobacterium erciyesense]MBQ0907144.1 murein L,D-transpeptidase catalytic domain family protein [Flavobacterium erciyesense]
MIYNTLPTLFISLCSLFLLSENGASISTETKHSFIARHEVSNLDEVEVLYQDLQLKNKQIPTLESFQQAVDAYTKIKHKGLVQKELLTIIDFSLSANTKRLWVIDMATHEVKFHSLVSHGRNTGEEFATSFSNAAESFKSSLGLYLTAEVYSGKHGLSLKLDGLEKGVNDHARARGIVMHAADYVSESFIKNNQRLGRSQGCPAVPSSISKEIINLIKNKSCFFIYHPSRAVALGGTFVS